MELSTIRLDKKASQPLYRQLAEQLKAAVQKGELQEGERLPPIRAWKEVLNISPITANQAYELLAEEGFTSGQVGRGTFVKRPVALTALPEPPSRSDLFPQPPVFRVGGALPDLPAYLNTLRTSQIQRALQTAQARHRNGPLAAQELIVLSSGSPASELFALRRWRSAMNRAGESFDQDEPRSQFQYGSSLGDPATRQWLATYLARFGLRCSSEEILLTTGSQQGLDLIARGLLGSGDSVLVESPSYVSALEIFENRGINWLPVSLDEKGLQIELLERLVERHRPRLLYTIPTCHSPTGLTMAADRRIKLLGLARRYNFWIVEDDTCNEFYYRGQIPAAIKSLDQEGRVIYLKSFSKLIFPAVRFGAVVAQGVALERLAEAKAVFDRSTSLPLARSVLKFADTPAFERELVEAQGIYHERLTGLEKALEAELAPLGCRWSRCEGGFSLLLSLPSPLRAEEFYGLAAEYGVGLLPASVLYPLPSEAPDNTLRVSFGDNPPAKLQEAVRRLKLALAILQTRPTTSDPGTRFVSAV